MYLTGMRDLGKNILEKNRDIKFLIAGREGPLTRLENPSWIEIGFTTRESRSKVFSELFCINAVSTTVCTILYYLMVFEIPYFQQRKELSMRECY